MKLEYRKPNLDELNKVIEIAKSAYASDVAIGGISPDGPEGFDDLVYYQEMLNYNHLFCLYLDGEMIAGAIIYINKDILDINRLFIMAEKLRQGYGQALINAIERDNQNIKCFKAKAQTWNPRTNSFLKKCGYKETMRDVLDVYYQKP